MRIRLLCWILFSCLFCISTMVWAQETKPDSTARKFFGVSLGLKGDVGGNYLTEPDDTFPGVALPFDEGGGGWGAGGGLYAEFRVLWGYLGLEVDVIFDHSKNWCSIEFNGIDTEWIAAQTAMRIPLLIEGHLENDSVRGSLGIGPEFVVGLNAKSDVQVPDEKTINESAAMDGVRDRFDAKKQTDTFLAVSLGLAFKVWKLAITLDLRYAYNLTQPEDYGDRVQIEGSGNNTAFTTIASNTMDGRLLLGVAYEFGFDY